MIGVCSLTKVYTSVYEQTTRRNITTEEVLLLCFLSRYFSMLRTIRARRCRDARTTRLKYLPTYRRMLTTITAFDQNHFNVDRASRTRLL